MSNFVSIERNMRGFNYQRDWRTEKGFWKAMEHNIKKENDEIEWSKLFDNYGTLIAEYNRGCELKQF